MCDRSDVSGIYIIGKLEMTGLENEQEQMESGEKHQNGRKTRSKSQADRQL